MRRAHEFRSRWSIAKVLTAGALGLFSLLPPSAAEAQTPVLLTLDEAQELAARHNPAYRRTANNLELNGIQMRTAWQTLLPRVSFTFLEPRMSWNLQRIGTDNFGNPIENPEARLVQSSQTRQSGSLNMSFDFANYLRLRQEADAVELLEASASSELNVLRGDIAMAFLDVQEQQLALTLEEELLEESRRNREAVEQLYALARVDRLEILRADLALADQENVVETSRANLANALLTLRNLIGDPEMREFELLPAALRTVDPGALNEERLVEIALASNSEIIQRENDLVSAGRDVTISKMQWLPRLSLSLSTSRSELTRESGDAFLSLSPSGSWDRNIGISLAFPDLGRFFDFQGSTARARISERNASETLRESHMRVEQEVRARIVELRLALRSQTIQEERVALADEVLVLSLESYRMGGGSFDELRTASDQAAQARRQALQARHAIERALIALERTLGVSLEEAGIALGTGG